MRFVTPLITILCVSCLTVLAARAQDSGIAAQIDDAPACTASVACQSETCPLCEKSPAKTTLNVATLNLTKCESAECDESDATKTRTVGIEVLDLLNVCDGSECRDQVAGDRSIEARLAADPSSTISSCAKCQKAGGAIAANIQKCGKQGFTIALKKAGDCVSGCITKEKNAIATAVKIAKAKSAAPNHSEAAAPKHSEAAVWQKLAWRLLDERDSLASQLVESAIERAEDRVETLEEAFEYVAQLRDELAEARIHHVEELAAAREEFAAAKSEFIREIAELTVEHTREVAEMHAQFSEELTALRAANRELEVRLADTSEQDATRVARKTNN